MKPAILEVIYRDVALNHYQSMLSLVELFVDTYGSEGYDHRMVMQDALVSRARGLVVTQFMEESDADVFLMVDADISFDPIAAHAMLALAYAGNKIYGGVYPTRVGGVPAQVLGGTSFTLDPLAKPVKVDAVATGYMAVNRDVVKYIIQQNHLQKQNGFYDLFPTGQGEKFYLSEDYGFCHLAARAGYECWIDPRQILRHASTQYIGWEYGTKFEPKQVGETGQEEGEPKEEDGTGKGD